MAYIPGSGGTGFAQGGNSFGAAARLGTNDAHDLEFETDNVRRAVFEETGVFRLLTGLRPETVAKTANFAPDEDEALVYLISNNTADVTATLPTGGAVGEMFLFAISSYSGSFSVYIAPGASQTINGSTSTIELDAVTDQLAVLRVTSTEWRILWRHRTFAANADTSGASLATVEAEVNELKALLRGVSYLAP